MSRTPLLQGALPGGSSASSKSHETDWRTYVIAPMSGPSCNRTRLCTHAQCGVMVQNKEFSRHLTRKHGWRYGIKALKDFQENPDGYVFPRKEKAEQPRKRRLCDQPDPRATQVSAINQDSLVETRTDANNADGGPITTLFGQSSGSTGSTHATAALVGHVPECGWLWDLPFYNSNPVSELPGSLDPHALHFNNSEMLHDLADGQSMVGDGSYWLHHATPSLSPSNPALPWTSSMMPEGLSPSMDSAYGSNSIAAGYQTGNDCAWQIHPHGPMVEEMAPQVFKQVEPVRFEEKMEQFEAPLAQGIEGFPFTQPELSRFQEWAVVSY